MTKKKMLELIDKAIETNEKDLDLYHEITTKCADSERIVSCVGYMYTQATSNLSQLKDIKKAIENHEEFIKKAEADKLFNMGYGCVCDPSDGIVYEGEEE